MMDSQTLIRALQSLQQKNNQGSGVAGGQAPMSPGSLGMQDQSTGQQGQQGQKVPSLMGWAGSQMDTPNAQGGIDPSWLTQINQGVMKQLGAQMPNVQAPALQQPQQQSGGGMMGGILKFLGSLL